MNAEPVFIIKFMGALEELPDIEFLLTTPHPHQLGFGRGNFDAQLFTAC